MSVISYDIQKALENIENLAKHDSGAHTVYYGTAVKDGAETGEPAIVVLVDKKLPKAQIQSAYDRVLFPQFVPTDDHRLRVDIQESPQFRILLLKEGERTGIAYNSPYEESNVRKHQQCFPFTVPAGAQISPRNSDWVGTLGVPWTWVDKNTSQQHYGFLTNRHVAGLERSIGDTVGQPNGRTKPIGVLRHYVDFNFNRSGQNELDLALYNAQTQLDGPHYIEPNIFLTGRVAPKIVSLKIGDQVVKSGRTTSTTLGRVIGLGASTTVDYGDHGSLRFRNQILIEGLNPNTPFSAPGDSGSGIYLPVSDGSSDGFGYYAFGALLFAGGGGRTLANPASLVAAAIPGKPFGYES